MRKFLTLFLLFLSVAAQAQFPAAQSSSELYHRLLKARNTGRILYIAAHPDDENTRLISYFENELHVRTAYLSLTRGAGGQNLVGTEIGAAIGVLRTQELLKARQIDGGEQFFTRAVDFGYSKTAEETFDKWDKEEVLKDVVWVIRKFRPDVIITRFPPNNYAGHGHHEASAVLAGEAFDLAADPSAFPEQLEHVDTWQATRLYFNASSWWNKDLPKKAEGSDDYISMDVGKYNPLLGETYAQIAARSRSSHASQGFGADYPYGSQREYLKYVKGDKADPEAGILDGIDTGWKNTTVPEVGDVLDRAVSEYQFTEPANSASDIISALKILKAAQLNTFIKYKQDELEALLIDLAGIDMVSATDEKYIVPGDTLLAIFTVNKSSGLRVNLLSVDELKIEDDSIKTNEVFTREVFMDVPADAEFDNPYWLNEPYENLYVVSDYRLFGIPENEPSLTQTIWLDIEGYEMNEELPVKYKTIDPTKGVVFTPVYVVPAVTCNFAERVVIATGSEPQIAELTCTSHTDDLKGTLRINAPAGWTVSPERVDLTFNLAGAMEVIEITLRPEAEAKSGKVNVEFARTSGTFSPAQSLIEIDYEHIPAQIILEPTVIKAVSIDLDRGGVSEIGYIDGPGDDVDKYLRAAGYNVTDISESELQSGNLNRFDAIVTGIRAYNTREDLAMSNAILSEYVKNGGTWLVQYNTSRGLKTGQIGPYPFTIDRGRVTDEGAVARILVPEHAIMNRPNKLDESDFDKWVQERGLYFAKDWSEKFTPLISWHDPEEHAEEGGLIVAPYGEGHFIYSGISFFRQLPAGVPGSYRLLANILALSENKPESHE